MFDDFADVFETLIDWPKRLANEAPFYRWIFEQTAARNVLDVACGTGHHLDLFHSLGLKVEGADASEEMISRCRRRWGENDSRRWVVRKFDKPIEPGSFDVAICIGNSAALAPDLAAVQRIVAQMLRAVRGGGAIVVHVLNIWSLPDGPCVWQKCTRSTLPAGERMIVKGVHRSGNRGYVDVVIVDPAAQPSPTMVSNSVPLLGLETAHLESAARDAGAGSVAFFGDYQRRPYKRSASVDLIMLASK